MTNNMDITGFLQDWKEELEMDDCPFYLDSWTGTLAACLFSAALVDCAKNDHPELN